MLQRELSWRKTLPQATDQFGSISKAGRLTNTYVVDKLTGQTLQADYHSFVSYSSLSQILYLDSYNL